MNASQTEGTAWSRLQLLSDILAPISILIAFLTYIGWIRTRSYFDYFGVNLSLLGLAPQDFLFRSVDVSLGGLFVLALAGAALIVVDRVTQSGIRRIADTVWRERVQVGIAVVAVTTLISLMIWTSSYAVIARTPPAIGAAFFAFSAIVLLRLRGSVLVLQSVVTTSLLVIVVLIAGLWSATIYARDLGESAALGLVDNPNGSPVVTIYSAEQLDLPLGGTITAARSTAFDGRWTYSYTGAVLLAYSNQRWFLISRFGDNQYRPAVVVIEDEPTIRIETSRTLLGR